MDRAQIAGSEACRAGHPWCIVFYLYILLVWPIPRPGCCTNCLRTRFGNPDVLGRIVL